MSRICSACTHVASHFNICKYCDYCVCDYHRLTEYRCSDCDERLCKDHTISCQCTEYMLCQDCYDSRYEGPDSCIYCGNPCCKYYRCISGHRQCCTCVNDNDDVCIKCPPCEVCNQHFARSRNVSICYRCRNSIMK